MKLWRRKPPNGADAELERLREEFTASGERVRRAAKGLAREAENLSKRQRGRRLEEQVERMRKSGAAE
jgi:hypothetical protein